MTSEVLAVLLVVEDREGLRLAFRYPPAPDRASDGDLGASGAVKSFFGDSSGTSGGVVDGLPGERASYSSAPLAVAGRTLNDLCAGTGETLARM